MNLEEICPIANSKGINLGKLVKIELIRALQADQGDFDCFASAHNGVCVRTNCMWREDCFAAVLQNYIDSDLTKNRCCTTKSTKATKKNIGLFRKSVFTF